MEKPEQLVFGLDIGTRSIVGTVGYKQTLNDFTVVAQEVKMHETRAMMDGQIHDISKVAETIEQVKRSLERQVGRKLSEVCIAAAGRVLKTVTTEAETEFLQETTVTAEMIRALELVGVENAYQRIKEETRGGGINYYCVAYTVIHYYLNGFQISNLEDHKANKIGAKVLATFLPDEVIDGLYTAVEKAGLKVANLTLEPIAAIQVAIPEKFRLLNIALVDVGAGTSDISITKDGSIVAYGMIPMAGDALTEVLAGAHLVDFATAEEIKLAAGTKKKTIAYKDIMGLPQKTTPAKVREELLPVMERMAKLVAEQILELNGGKPVSAVFIVGGGGKFPDYTECLAKYLGLPKERVALRGEEVLSFVRFLQEDIKKDPMLVTPIGICLNYYEKKNNFIFVTVNGESVKLYDNNKLTVIDAAMQLGFPNEYLFPRRGKELNFTLNGNKRMVRGEAGEAAAILVNSRPGAANTQIQANDEITIQESTVGKAAEYEVRQLPEYRSAISFIVNGKQVVCPKFILANGHMVSGYYSIKEGDELSILGYYTLGQLLEFMDIPYTENILVNHMAAGKDEKVYENFMVECPLLNEAEDLGDIIASQPMSKAETEKELPSEENKTKGRELMVIVNHTPVVLRGKETYCFVDVLDFYPFDSSKAHGAEVVMTRNGEKAAFTDKLEAGDELELYWK